jgi:hypothetical protein
MTMGPGPTPLWPPGAGGATAAWPDAGVEAAATATPMGSPAVDAGAPVDVAVAVDTGGGAAPGSSSPAPANPAPASPAPAVAACPPGVDALTLITQRCGNCHGARSPSKGLDLVSTGLADRLIATKSTCQNQPQLDVGTNPAAPGGHFIDKLKGAVPGCGAQMPYGTAPLTGPELDCLVEWSGRAIARAQKGQ